jgi:predicted glycogen debranching enzyme
MHAEPSRRLNWSDTSSELAEQLTNREWLVTNGIGGYASGSIAGIPTRRFHALLVAALPAPIGRATLLHRLTENIRLPSGELFYLGGEESDNGLFLHAGSMITEFRLEAGLPVWRYSLGSYVIEKRVLLVHMQNTVHVTYRLLEGEGTLRIKLRPWVYFRAHEGQVAGPRLPYRVVADGDRYEMHGEDAFPALRVHGIGVDTAFTLKGETAQLRYRVEESRGYDFAGALASPGYFRASLSKEFDITVVASSESWEAMLALTPEAAREAERSRRRRLLDQAHPQAQTGVAAELVLAADQFIITPATRAQEAARAQAAGDEVRTVIAGYHWFTDWGRDTMISLEGLTLLTGRHAEAGYILRTFAQYVRDGLIPNMFPEGKSEGLYHTADATLWFFHALARYVEVTGDRFTLEQILPTLKEIADAHLRGTRFGIAVDPNDGLLRQGAEGYQLTWMDAKVDGWVVTPRRGKAVEINALFYNALRLLSVWLREHAGEQAALPYEAAAERARSAFNERFWYERGRHLYDVIDGESGDDPACRPNQLFAISLPYPILDREHWPDVLDVCERQLLTPFGLRSLAPGHPDYKSRYFGDLRTRDAAYHQGTVWSWLIGPYVDAHRKVRPDDIAGLRRAIEGFTPHLDDSCVGSVSEIFDAEAPYCARGCVAQAWSVAELLRCWVTLNGVERTV